MRRRTVRAMKEVGRHGDAGLRARVCAVVALPALVVAPLAGIDPGLQSALKLAAVCFAALVFAFSVRRYPRLSAFERCLTAFVSFAVASTILAGSGLAAGALVVLSATCLLSIARAARATLRDQWMIVEDAVGFTTVALATVAMLELCGVHLPFSHVWRPESTIGNRNELAGYLVMALPVLVGASLRKRRFALPAVALVTTIIVVTRCRSAYLAAGIAFAAGFVAYWMRRPRHGVVVQRDRWVATLASLAAGIGLAALPWPGVRFAPSIAHSAGRVFEYEKGSGLARLMQHRLGLTALGANPMRWAIGFGAGSWERVASEYAHAIGGHVPMFTGSVMPNSELLRVVVEQGLIGLALLATALFLVARHALSSRGDDRHLVPRAATLATLAAASVYAAFDPVLVRPESIALLGVLVGALAAPPRRRSDAGDNASGRRLRLLAVGLATSVVALLRAASFAVASPIAVEPGSPRWEARQQIADDLFPRPSIDERRAITRAAGRRCEEAEAALDRFVAERPDHWGARARVAQCFMNRGDERASVRVWRAAMDVEPHLRELLDDDAARHRDHRALAFATAGQPTQGVDE